MASVGSLVVDLIANTASFNANIEKAAANLNSNTAKINRSLEGMKKQFEHANEGAKLLVEALAVKEVAEAVKGALEFAAAMKIQADRIGITAETMQLYHLAGKRVGSTNDEVDTGLKKLTVSMGQAELGAKKQQEIFKALGVDYHATATVAIPQLADGLAKIGNDSKRHALEVATMGRAAVALDPLFRQGAEGIAKMKDEAEKAGLILGDQFAEKAHEASVKMDELVTILKVDFAKEVINNADSIVGLAKALEQATLGAMHYIAQYPRLSAALTGAAIGSRFGPYGAVAGAAAGYVIGDKIAQNADDANTDVRFRAAKLRGATATMRRYLSDEATMSPAQLAESKTSYDRRNAVTELHRQQQLLNLSLHPLPTLPPLDPDGIGNLLGGGGAQRRARAVKDPLADADERYGREMAQIGEAILQARKSNLTDIDAIAKIDKQLLAKEVEAKDFAIDKEVKDKHITEAQGEQLKFANAILATAKAITVDNQAAEQHAQANLEMQIAANDNQKELLGIQDQLAVTQKEHRDIQLRILEIDKQEERARLEAVGASKTTSDAEKQIAAAKLKQLDAVYTGKAEVVKNQTAGPGEAYLKSIIDDAKSVNEALQNIEVSGLKSLNDGLVEAIMGAKSLGEVFTNVANQISADLLRLAMQTLIIGPRLARTMRRLAWLWLVRMGPNWCASVAGSKSFQIIC